MRRPCLSADQKRRIWEVFGRVYEDLNRAGLSPLPIVCREVCEDICGGRITSRFDAVIADEVQDLGCQELRLLAAFTAHSPELLMLLGDSGQRIFPGGYSLKKLGIVARPRQLRVAYRTAERIRRAAERILTGERDDLNGATEQGDSGRGIVFGSEPEFIGFETKKRQWDYLLTSVRAAHERGVDYQEIGILYRTNALARAAHDFFTNNGVPARLLEVDSPGGSDTPNAIQVGTMHRAKGLEYRTVFLPSCDRDILPNTQALREELGRDESAAVSRERQLLYVAMTRARDDLVVSWVGEPSEFLLPLLPHLASRLHNAAAAEPQHDLPNQS